MVWGRSPLPLKRGGGAELAGREPGVAEPGGDRGPRGQERETPSKLGHPAPPDRGPGQAQAGASLSSPFQGEASEPARTASRFREGIICASRCPLTTSTPVMAGPVPAIHVMTRPLRHRCRPAAMVARCQVCSASVSLREPSRSDVSRTIRVEEAVVGKHQSVQYRWEINGFRSRLAQRWRGGQPIGRAENLDQKMRSLVPIRSDVLLNLHFQRPLLDWQPVSRRFFSMLYDGLTPKYNISPSDLSVFPGNNLGEIFVRFSLFGGGSNISLFANRLSIEFSNLTEVDNPIAIDVVSLIHDAFNREFTDVEPAYLEYRAFDHYNIVGEEISAVFFDDFIPAKLAENVQKFKILIEPGIQFRIVDAEHNATATCLAERSVLAPSGIFLSISVNIGQVARWPTFEQKQKRISELAKQCLDALNLRVITDDE